jgi:pre-mRNA-splicing factor CWC26
MEWGKGLVQKREYEEKIKNALHEFDKPLARYANDQDLDGLLKNQEREEDPMLEYIKSQSTNDTTKLRKQYKGPQPPPNRYNILPGYRWDGVDRSNGFEKKYYESIKAKKTRADEAYKWSVEDM